MDADDTIDSVRTAIPALCADIPIILHCRMARMANFPLAPVAREKFNIELPGSGLKTRHGGTIWSQFDASVQRSGSHSKVEPGFSAR